MAAKKKVAKAPAKKALAKGRRNAPKAASKLGTSSVRDADGLTAREAQFVLEYLLDTNATQAAIRCGFSERSAYQKGHEISNKPHVKAAIDARRKQVTAKLEITLERVLEEIGKVAFFSFSRLKHPDGSIKRFDELDEDTLAAIQELEVVGGMVLAGSVKFHGKLKALDMLMRNLGGYKADNKQKADAVGALLEAISDRGPGLTVKP